MEEYFLRQYPLFGEKKQKSLKSKSIAIIGCGGLGSNLALTLGSSGIGKVYLVDFDVVAVHNIHRQIAYRLEDINKPKAKLLAKILRDRYDGVEVIEFVGSFEEFKKIDAKYDVLIDGTDNLPTRAKLEMHARELNIPWVYASVEEFHGYVCFFKNSTFAKAITINDRVSAGIAPPIVSLIASFEANLVLRYLVGLNTEMDILNYLYFDEDGIFRVDVFQMPI